MGVESVVLVDFDGDGLVGDSEGGGWEVAEDPVEHSRA